MNKDFKIKIVLFLGDVMVTQVALFLALFLRNHTLINQFQYFFNRFIFLYLLWILVIFILNLYDLHFFARPIDFLFNILIFFVVAIFLSATYFYFITPTFAPKAILLLDLIIFSVGFFAFRYFAHIFLQTYIFPKTDAKHLYEKMHKKISLENLDLEKINKKENRLEEFLKRLLDVVVSILGLVVCGALFPIIGLAIVIDSRGGIFYSQERVGKNGKVFLIYKFRSMRQKDEKQQELWREKEKNNITHVGSILRRLHLDELPQAWSMLKGDISFVGPRPEWIEFAKIFEKEIPFYQYRYLVKPGIIGWAQVNFPPSQSVKEAQEKFEYDLYYIKNRSLLLDLEIILKAVKLFFF